MKKHLQTILAALLLTACITHAADVKTSALSALTTPASGDLIRIVDISDTSSAATGTSKKITLANFSTALTPTWANISGKPTTLSAAGITGGSVLDTLGGLTQTGTANLVRSASPTFTGTIEAAAMNMSGALSVTGALDGSTLGMTSATFELLYLEKTITAAATTGAQTINKAAGSVNFAAAATSLVVTNTLVTTGSVIVATVGTNDTTLTSGAVVAAAGSFTLHANAAATAETRVNFIVIN